MRGTVEFSLLFLLATRLVARRHRRAGPGAGQVERGPALGGRTFAREARARDEGKEPIVLTFPAALAKDATAALRAAGFRFNKVLQHWEGLARFDEAQQLAVTHGGTAKRVSPPSVPAALDTAAD